MEKLIPIEKWSDLVEGKYLYMKRQPVAKNSRWEMGKKYRIASVNKAGLAVEGGGVFSGKEWIPKRKFKVFKDFFDIVEESSDCHQKHIVGENIEDSTSQLDSQCDWEAAPSATLTKIETTYSAVLEFPPQKPGGPTETVEIPGPEGEDWESETERFDWPHKYFWNGTVKMNLAGYQFAHKEGESLFREYHSRISFENARIVSITKYTRSYKSEVKEIETHGSSLPPEPEPSPFWIEDHEVVFRKENTGTHYPGSDRRKPEPEWSGIWMEGHAPRIVSEEFNSFLKKEERMLDR